MTEAQGNKVTTVFPTRVREELEKLTASVNTIMDNMRRMEHPIVESREQLPKANAQLDKVSAQTEKATHKMLDMVEQIIDHQEKLMALNQEVTPFLGRSRSKLKDVYVDKMKRIGELAAASQNNAFLIMDALQFQDITAQQMQHASTLLEDIERRLQNLLGVFEGREILEPDNAETTRKVRAYDPDADLFEGRNQKEVDDIVSTVVQKK